MVSFYPFVLLALSAKLTTADTVDNDEGGSLMMAVGTNGATVAATRGTTSFMNTEYNPDRCVLQFLSLECDDESCGELNGFKLECVSKGLQNGREKKMCECQAADSQKCQNSVSPNATSGTVAQFGECSDQLRCVDSYGYIATSQEEGPVCAERLHCLQEINSKATAPASICHTCMSCIAQNDAAEKQLAAAKRFNCSAICPQEILETVAERNAAGVGIADSYTVMGSASGSAAEGSSTVPDSTTDVQDTSASSMVKPQTKMGVMVSVIVAAVLVAVMN
uniref:Cysteine-rich protein n=2 Tax=Hyaloperonospora arabidopsidis (strain Emoy2) TaxID=559515 RepID=M4C0T1_HYAAE